MSHQVGILVGSLRKESINRKLAKALVKAAPEDLSFSWIDIGSVPLFNQDEEDAGIPAVDTLRNEIRQSDALLIVTPEYSRSLPGVLKNVLDWASRPYGKNTFAGKPVLIAGTSGGGIATAPAQLHLRGILGNLDAYPLGQPELYIQSTPGLIDDDGNVSQDSTRQFLGSAMKAFSAHIKRFA